MTLGVVGETAPGERRVALDPETAAKLVGAGHRVAVELGAGRAASFPEQAYDAELRAGQLLLGVLAMDPDDEAHRAVVVRTTGAVPSGAGTAA